MIRQHQRESEPGSKIGRPGKPPRLTPCGRPSRRSSARSCSRETKAAQRKRRSSAPPPLSVDRGGWRASGMNEDRDHQRGDQRNHHRQCRDRRRPRRRCPSTNTMGKNTAIDVRVEATTAERTSLGAAYRRGHRGSSPSSRQPEDRIRARRWRSPPACRCRAPDRRGT